jgi:DNA-binding beta-propeller fold protein YncE
MKPTHVALLVALLSTLNAMAYDGIPTRPMHVDVQRSELGGAGGWDDLSVDSEAHRLYLSRSDRVMVVDTLSGAPAGEVPNTNGVHGIALVPALHVGFTSNGKADTVTVFDLKTLKPLIDIKVTGSNPDTILYDPYTKRVVVFNGKTSNATVIDASARTVVGTIALDGRPEFARADGRGHVFVNIEDKGEVSELDPKTATVVATWSLGDCEEPSGLALDIAHRRLFSVCQNNKMVVTDADSGKHVADVPIGAGPDGAAFDAARGLVFSPNGKDGTLTIVHQDDSDHYSVVAIVPTRKSARTIVLDEITHLVYLPAADFDPLPANAPAHTRPTMKVNSFVLLNVSEHFCRPGECK